jgi:hypothetical protein
VGRNIALGRIQCQVVSFYVNSSNSYSSICTIEGAELDGQSYDGDDDKIFLKPSVCLLMISRGVTRNLLSRFSG